MATVLIVDDEPDIVLFVRMNLELEGYDVIDAGDGRTGISMVREHHPDAVLLDVMLPEMDGWSVLEELKSDPDDLVRTIPVVMMTALASEADQVRGGIEGAVVYLPKPVLPTDMVDAVARAIDGDPEPVQRKAAQQRALERLARIESGASGSDAPGTPRPRLTRLEHSRSVPTTDRPTAVEPPGPIALTDTQRTLLLALKQAPSVSDAAVVLGMSRSNIYASLRRVGRRFDEPDVSRLLRRLRAGELDASLQP